MGYTARQIAQALGLSPAQLRSLAKAGLVEAVQGRYSFHDLVLLRTAKELVDARVPRGKIRGALEKLRAEMPDSLSGLRISAEARDVVVDDGVTRWAPGSGQTHFAFEDGGAARVVRPADGERTAEQWFDMGCELEDSAPADAETAYRRTIELEPTHADAHINLGRLLHENGRLAEAEQHYRAAQEAAPGAYTARFNLGVVLEDMDRWDEALRVYEGIDHPDAHYNAAVICERLGRRTEALRHFKRCRQLTS